MLERYPNAAVLCAQSLLVLDFIICCHTFSLFIQVDLVFKLFVEIMAVQDQYAYENVQKQLLWKAHDQLQSRQHYVILIC